VRRALSETSSRACLDASTDTIPGATTDGLVSDGSYPSIVCIASTRAVPPVGQYRITLPHERLLAEEIARTGRQLDLHRQKEFRALPPQSARSAVEVKARFPAGPPPDR
jgi:hypothetical protein